jgi:hypothetical protein
MQARANPVGFKNSATGHNHGSNTPSFPGKSFGFFQHFPEITLQEQKVCCHEQIILKKNTL